MFEALAPLFWRLASPWQSAEGLSLIELFPYPIAVILFAGLFGGCFGSFANAAAMRLVRDESPILPPSRCRFCEKPLGWRENLPLFGWVFLKGRCACAKFKLPARYVLVEWGFAGLTIILALILPWPLFVVVTILNIIMMIALLTDSEAMVLHPPSLLAGSLFAIGAALLLDSWPIAWQESLMGAVFGAGIIMITNFIYKLTRGKNGFGQGDIWLLGMIGASFGLWGAIMVFFTASFIGALVGITLIFVNKAESGSKLPFGLFLSLVFLLYPPINMLLI